MEDRLNGVIQVGGVLCMFALATFIVISVIGMCFMGVHSYDVVADVKVVDKRIDTRSSTTYMMVGKVMMPNTRKVDDHILVVEWENSELDIEVTEQEYNYYDNGSYVTVSIDSERKSAVIGVK